MTGILLIDKEADWTSHDVVAKLRRILSERRIGHAGTLDPMATGLLTVFVGRATRAVQFAEAEEKTYRAHLRLGIESDTQDTTGNILNRSDKQVTETDVQAILSQFTGEILQVPPMYSALKVNGQKLYDLARRGQTVERAARRVCIHAITIEGRAGEDYILNIRCSKGTYIRTLCHDMGAALGTYAVMSALRRTDVGAFSVRDACTIGALAEMGRPQDRLLPLDGLFGAHPAVTLTKRQAACLRYGQEIKTDVGLGNCRLYDEAGEFMAFAVADGARFQVQKRFFTTAE